MTALEPPEDEMRVTSPDRSRPALREPLRRRAGGTAIAPTRRRPHGEVRREVPEYGMTPHNLGERYRPSAWPGVVSRFRDG